MLRPRYNTDKTLNSRKADIQPLKETLQALVNAYKLQGKLNEVTIVESWEKIMGRAIAIKTQEIYFRNGKLFVRISSAPLKHELVMAKTKVIELINAEVGTKAISEVVFL
jgi:predicted nucleic acid-binding Zn ribbon protein